MTEQITVALHYTWIDKLDYTNSETNPNPIVSALRDLPNIAQFVKCCANNKLISGAAHYFGAAENKYPYLFVFTESSILLPLEQFEWVEACSFILLLLPMWRGPPQSALTF